MLKNAVIIALAVLSFSTLSFGQDREGSMGMSMGAASKPRFDVTLFSIVSRSNMSFGKTETDTRSLDSYNYISLNQKLDADTKIALRVPFTFTSEGQNTYADHVDSSFALQDVHLVYSKYDLGYIGDVDISGNMKVYLPTSEFSQNAKMISKFAFETFFEYSISRFSSVTYALKPDVYWQRQTAFLNPDTPQYDNGTFKKDPRGTNRQYALKHYLEATIDMNRFYSVKPKIGFDEDWYYASVIEELPGNHVTKLNTGFGVEIRPMRGLTFTVGLQNLTTLGSYKGKNVSFWQPENTQYSVLTNAFLF